MERTDRESSTVSVGKDPLATSLIGARRGSTYEAVISGSGREVFRAYRARWHMLAIFCFLSVTNSIMWISFAPIVPNTKQFYGVQGDLPINMLSMIFMIAYFPASILQIWVINKWGLRCALTAAASMGLVAGWLRYISSVKAIFGEQKHLAFSVLFFGQTVAAIAQPFFTNTAAKMAGEWFPVAERDVATVIGSLFNPLGNAIGNVLPALLVTCATSTSGACVDVKGMSTLMLVQAILGTLAWGWCFGWFRQEPPTPPSKSALERKSFRLANKQSPKHLRIHPTQMIKRDIATILGDREFRKLLVGFGIGLALFNALLTVVEQIIQPVYCDPSSADPSHIDVNAAQSDAGVYGAALIGVGLVGAGIVGPILDKTHKYKLFLKLGYAISLFAVLLFVYALKPDNSAMVASSFGVMGLVMMPLLPVSLETGVECTYPVPEESSSMMLMSVGNLLGAVFIYAYQELIDLRKNYCTETGGFLKKMFNPAAILTLSVVCFASAFIFTYNGPYKRLEAEKQEAMLRESISDDDEMEPIEEFVADEVA